MNNKYNIIFKGEIKKGQNLDVVKSRFEKYLKLNPQKIIKLFSGRTVIIKKSVDKNEAKSVLQRLYKLGAICHIINQNKVVEKTILKKLPFEGFNYNFLPAPLCTVISKLIKEQSENGVSTTADETCEIIETWFKFVGGLLLAEYLDAGAPSHDLNRYTFASLESKRGLFLGQWVAQARGCLKALNKVWDEGFEPTWPTFRNLNFGDPHDTSHPVTRLVSYRNNFSHGSFSQVETEIIDHGLLLEEQVSILVNDLKKRPICFTLPDGAVGVLEGEKARKDPDQKSQYNLPPYTPYVALPDGKQRILAPALAVSQNETRFLLLPSNMTASSDPSFLIRFEQALERFRREQKGYVKFGEDNVPFNLGTGEHNVEGVDKAITKENVLTLIEYRPGIGQKLLAGQLVGGLRKMLSLVEVWRVMENHPGSSGAVFGRFLLRLAEKTLALNEGHLEKKGVSITKAVSTAGRLLAEAGKAVGIVIMDSDQGIEKPPNESVSVIEVCKAASTSHSGFRLILLSNPTFDRKLPHDGSVLTAPLPEAEQIDNKELETALRDWCKMNGSDGELILKWLCDRSDNEPLFLSEIVEEIAGSKEHSVFPPSVEHAIWVSASFIDRNIDDEGRVSLQPAGGYGGYYHNCLKKILCGF
jgi:hypothetical protein